MNPLRRVINQSITPSSTIQNLVSVQSAVLPASESSIVDLRITGAPPFQHSPAAASTLRRPTLPPSFPSIHVWSPSLPKCRASLFVGFLVPVIIVAAVFFTMTYLTLNRSAHNSVVQISDHLFDVSVLHLAHAVNDFLEHMPVITAILASHIDVVHNDTDSIKVFLAKTLLSAPVGPAPFAMGYLRTDASVLIVRRELDNELHIIQRPKDGCEQILSIPCSHIAMWKMDPSTFERVGSPMISYEYITQDKYHYKAVLANAKPTYWLPHTWEVTGDVAAALLVPIFDHLGSVQAMVFADYRFSSLTSVFQTAQSTLGTTGTILLVNKDGVPLASSMEGHADGGLGAADLARLNGLPTTGPPSSHAYELNLDTYGSSFVLQLNFNGDGRSVAGLNWRIFIVFPRSDFYSLLDTQNRVQVGLMVGCVVAFLAVLVMLFFVLLRRPLTRLSQSLMNLKQIITCSHVESHRGFVGTHKLQFSAFSELARVQQVFLDVLDVVQAAENAAEQRVQELKSAAETQRARERTENLMRSKEQFFQMMSHQLRSPLDAILGMAEVLGKTTLSVQQRECTDSIMFSATAMASVVDNILDFGQLEANRMVLEKKLFSVRKLIEKVAQAMGIHAEKKKLELIVHIDHRVPDCILGDENRLNQVLMNLLTNAIRCTEDGHVLLKCYPENQRLRFDVDDTGIGMSTETICNGFEPFSQPPRNTSSPDSASRDVGLGLAIAHRLVALMQGALVAFSDGEHQGSTFTFSIPLDKSISISAEPPSNVAVCQSDRHERFEGEGHCSQPASPLLSSDSDRHGGPSSQAEDDTLKELSRTVLIVDPLTLRGRAIQELIKTLELDHVYASSIDQIRSFPFGHPAVHASVVVSHLQDYSSAKPATIVTSFRATHVPHTLNRRVVFVVDLATQATMGFGAGDADGYCFVSKPVTLHKLTVALQQLAPNLLEKWKSPIEPFLEPNESEFTYDDDDLESFCENRILIVDDNAVDQRAAVMLLQQKGLKYIDSASNSAEALHLVQANSVPYDIIVVAFDDVKTGCELTRRILEIPKQTKVPVIGLARSFLGEGINMECQGSGMKAILAKPLDVHEFICSVQKYLLPGNVSATASWARPCSQPMPSGSATPPSQLSQFIPLPS